MPGFAAQSTNTRSFDSSPAAVVSKLQMSLARLSAKYIVLPSGLQARLFGMTRGAHRVRDDRASGRARHRAALHVFIVRPEAPGAIAEAVVERLSAMHPRGRQDARPA